MNGWADLAERVAAGSQCVRAQVGAVLVSASGELLGRGRNLGQNCAALCPRGRSGAPRKASWLEFPCIAHHAEMRALMDVEKHYGTGKVRGATMYLAVRPGTGGPCPSCAAVLVALGVTVERV